MTAKGSPKVRTVLLQFDDLIKLNFKEVASSKYKAVEHFSETKHPAISGKEKAIYGGRARVPEPVCTKISWMEVVRNATELE